MLIPSLLFALPSPLSLCLYSVYFLKYFSHQKYFGLFGFLPSTKLKSGVMLYIQYFQTQLHVLTQVLDELRNAFPSPVNPKLTPNTKRTIGEPMFIPLLILLQWFQAMYLSALGSLDSGLKELKPML